MRRYSRSRVVALCWFAGLALAAGCLASAAPPGPVEARPAAPPPADPLVAAFPRDPDFPEMGDADADRPSFNDFSWRAFIALNWPADPARRGVPDPARAFGDTSGPVVWGTWKSLDELFPSDPRANPPTEWASYEAALAVRWLDREKKSRQYEFKELPREAAGRFKVLQQTSKLGDFLQAGSIRAPLVAQNRTILRYEVRANRMAYDFIRNNEYYIKENLPGLVGGNPIGEFPEGTVHVKAAWMELPDDPGVRGRFYHLAAKVVDWDAGNNPVLLDRTVGLVGLHIVAKTPKRKDWIWSTFEHVDNLAPAPGGRAASLSAKVPPLAFGPAANQPPPEVFEPGRPLPTAASPVEVVRKDPIHPQTEEVNTRYRDHPQVKGTVWENYRLVGTQWPRNGARTRDDGAGRLPPALANVSMETYTQSRSCLACHATANPDEFVFYPAFRAVDTNQP